MGAELKPCPFCNGNAEVKERYRKGIANRKMYWVECKKCGVSQAHHELAGYRTPNKAIAVWNHRWQENDMGYYSSNAYRDLKWFEKMSKEANVGKRDFKQIDKIHRKNKMKKGK